MQHRNVENDDFILGAWIISQSCIHTQSLWYNQAVQEVEKFVYRTLVQDPNME